jgi:uncharacterized OB-fold protein
MTVPDRPMLPPDRDSLPFWEGIDAGELRVQRCRSCGARRWPARAICNRCRSFDAEWVVLSGTGTVISWTRTHQVFAAAFKGEVPYVTLLVRLDEQDDLQMIGAFAEGGVAPAAGMRVKAVFRPVTADRSLIFWEPLYEEGPR